MGSTIIARYIFLDDNLSEGHKDFSDLISQDLSLLLTISLSVRLDRLALFIADATQEQLSHLNLFMGKGSTHFFLFAFFMEAPTKTFGALRSVYVEGRRARVAACVGCQYGVGTYSDATLNSECRRKVSI